MLSKSISRARTVLVCFLVTGCITIRDEGGGEPPLLEYNLAFVVERNLLRLPTAEINGREGRFFFASSHGRTVIDPQFSAALGQGPYRLQLSARESLPISPVFLDLQSAGDALIGADVWNGHAVTIDYFKGLLTYQTAGIQPAEMTLYSFQTDPIVFVEVDGRQIPAVVDTMLADTLLLPRGEAGGERRFANIVIAGTNFGPVDVALGEVPRARIGNRLLAHFLVTIDYGRRQVGLWLDPRIPL